jgi:Cu(I)/Ag(I) efflux system membrane fusion protein
MRLTKFIPFLLGGLLILGIYGCSSPEPDPVTPPATPASDTAEDHADHDHGDHADHDHGDHATADSDSPMAKMMPGLKELSPEDYKSAMAQHMCPVSGEMLGTMGAPEKVDVNGKSVWICCDGCKDKLLADPDKYLAKLK